MHYKASEGKRGWDFLLMAFMVMVSGFTLWLLYKTPERIMFWGTTVLMVGVTLYIVYIIWAARTLSYSIERDAIIIHYGFQHIRIPYDSIIKVEEQQRLNMQRLAGNHYPGHYSGYFKEFREKRLLAVYAKRKEKVIAVHTPRLKYIITPENNRTFLARLATTLPDYASHRLAEDKIDDLPPLWHTREGLAMLALNIAGMMGLGAYIWIQARHHKTVPLHYNLQGQVDRYGSPLELLMLLLGPVIILPIIIYVSNILARHGIRGAARYLWIPFFLTALMACVAFSTF